MALPPMGPMSPPSPFLGGPQQNMGPPPMPPMPQMGGGMGPPPAPPMGPPQMGPPPINPVNPAGNGQSFGGDAGGRKTFSQYLQSMNTSFPPTPPVPDPMAGGIGGGAPSMPPLAMMGGGAVPRQTMIGREPHSLAYINPGEEMMLRASGGTGEPGPGGVPAFRGGAGGYGGFGEGFGFGGGGGEGPSNGGGGGGVDIGFMNALADQVAEEQEAAAVAESNEMMSPLGGADAIARSNLVDSFMDTKDGRDLAMFNDSFADIPSQVTSAVPVSNIATDDVGVNTLDEAFLNQYNDPNLSVSLPGTNINMPDVSSLLGGVVRPDMMPPGYQPTPDEPTFDQFVSNKAAVGRPIDRIDPTLGQPGSINLDAQMPTGIQDPSGLSSFNNMTGIDDSSFSTPIGVETGMQDPSQVATGIVDSPQLDESARDAIVDTGLTTSPISARQEVTGPSGNLNIDAIASVNEALNNQNPNNPAAAESLMGAPIGDPAMDRREAALGDMNTSATPEVDPGPMQGPYNQTDEMRAIAAKNRQLAEAMRVAEAGVQNQEDIANAGFNPLSLLPFGRLLGTPQSRKQAAINQVISQSGGSGILGSGIGGSTGILGTGAVTFNAVYDANGNFVGSQGVSESGETVSYSGNMQGNNGYFDGDGNNISENIEGYQEEIGGQGSPGGMDVDYNPCQPGYELDPESGTCVPIDVVGGGDSSGPPTLGPIIRPVTPPVTTPVEPTPPAPVSSPTLVTPKQFNMGGATSGSNLDGAIGRLLSSMS